MRLQTLASLLSLALALPGRSQTPANEPPPNLVIIFADDLGYGDLGSYGHPTIRTPHLDRMAREGIRFTQFYAAGEVCTPSRAALLTGRYPVRTGMAQGLIPGRVLFPSDRVGLPPSEVTIAEMLKQRGYSTMAVGKWHLGHLPEFLPTAQGFDGYFGVPYSNDMDHVPATQGHAAYWNVPLMRNAEVAERPADQSLLTRRYTEEAVRFISEHRERPFFLYLAHTMPHIPLFTSPTFAGVSARGIYGDVIEELDWSVGEVLAALRASGLAEKTLVLFTSDNGPWAAQKTSGGSAGLLRDGKGTTWEGGMRVPMIAWWPGRIPAGRTAYEVATTLDLLPTAAALSGARLPERPIDGFDILPVLLGTGASPRDLFAYYRGDQLFAARSGPWKAHFLTQSAYPDGPVMSHDPPLLFHLEHDPGERFDISKDNPEVIASIRNLVVKHESEIGRTRVPSVEAESLIRSARPTGGRVQIQDMKPFGSGWSGDAQLWWVEAKPGDRLVLPLESAKTGSYELVGFFTRAGDYGIVRLHVNGKPAGSLMDGWSSTVEPTGPVSFGRVDLRKGTNQLVIELVGKDVRAGGYSGGYLAGIDGFLLRE